VEVEEVFTWRWICGTTVEPGRILVRIERSGVCHTDLHAAEGDWPVKPALPFIPGHEGVGVRSGGGPGSGRGQGRRSVGVPWLHTACRSCEYCVGGWETLCESQQNTGYSVDGGFAAYTLADPAFVGHLPADLGFADAAPVLCAGVTVYKGLEETEVRPGEWVVISGIGGLGHMAVQYAKALGMHVIGVDIHPDKLRLAAELGADITINAAEEDPVARVIRQVGGAHGVLVTAVSPKPFSQAVGMLRRRGTMALVGLPPGGFDLPIFDIVLTRKTIRGSIVGTRNDLSEALRIAAEGKALPRVTAEPIERINDIFDRMRAGTIDGRIVVTV
jgi:alcohol dehydrogenase, propanol-preferring